jgi:hypothetical protein
MQDQAWPYLWLIVPGLLGLLGLAVLAAGLGALVRLKPLRAISGLLGGTVFLLGAAVILFMGADFQTFSRLAWERPVAIVDLHRTGDGAFDAVLTQPQSLVDYGPDRAAPPQRTFALTGDEWRLEAKVLKWKPWVNTLGWDTRYRLERLAGESADAAAERTGPRSGFDLDQPTAGPYAMLPDRLRAVSARLGTFHLIDTVYGSAVVMPMADGAEYEVSITQSGLVARPMNAAAKQATGTAS